MDHDPNDLEWLAKNDPIHYEAVREARRYLCKRMCDKAIILCEKTERDCCIGLACAIIGFIVVCGIILRATLIH